MVHKSSIVPGISKFIDENVLAHYPATSMKRIMMAGAVSLYLKQNGGLVDTISSNPLFSSLGVVHDNGMIELEPLRDALKYEINKAGFMRLNIPLIGAIDFTPEDADALYKYIIEANTTQVQSPSAQLTTGMTTLTNGGVY
jgi:hypothetical protein